MTNERMTKVYNTRETMPDDMIAGSRPKVSTRARVMTGAASVTRGD